MSVTLAHHLHTDVKHVLTMLEQSQWKNNIEIKAKQLQRLSFLLQHAYDTVPFYQSWLAQTTYTPGMNITTEWFQQLPILTRAHVKHDERQFHSSALDENKYIYKLATSGSTGVSVNIIGTYETEVYWRALGLRDHLWHQRDFNKTLAAIRWSHRGIAMPPLGDIYPNWGTVTEGIYDTGPSLYLNVISDTSSQINWLVKNNPEYLLSFPSQIKVLAEYCLDNDIQLNNLKQVRTIGETVNRGLRQLVKKAWNAKLTDVYSAEEFGYLAIQCPEHDHYHIQSENVYLEVINEQGLACKHGETGKIIITGLHNLAMPLIRYEIGDYATVGKPCSCGRDGLPVFTAIEGRTRNRLHYPNGESRFPYLGDHEDYRRIVPKTTQFQFIQHDINTIEYKIATNERMTPNREQACKELIQRNFGHTFDINITYHEYIPKQPNGKFEEFLSLVGSAVGSALWGQVLNCERLPGCGVKS